jgi:hypothetical protein
VSNKRISPLDNVSHNDFIKIVQDMKPKIGVFGGRYFVSGKKSYTMNQIAEKLWNAFGTGRVDEKAELGQVIIEKDKQATAMLKKASCFQRVMTKIKQKEGNRQFKKHCPLLIGKETILRVFVAVARKREASEEGRSQLPTVNPPPQNERPRETSPNIVLDDIPIQPFFSADVEEGSESPRETSPIVFRATDNIQPSTELTGKQKEEISHFLSQVESLAPDANRALTCTVYGVEYKIWWNSAAKAANIQRKENFFGATSELKKINKLGIKEVKDSFYLYQNDIRIDRFSQEQQDLILALTPQVHELKLQYNALDELKNKFNSKCLDLLRKFLQGKGGSAYRYDANVGEVGSSELLLSFGDSIGVWMRCEGSSNKKKYYINFQEKTLYDRGLSIGKLGIELDGEGFICSVHINQQKADVMDVFSAQSLWNCWLTKGMNHFLETMALNKLNTHYSIALHPLLLSQRPEAALQHICRSGSFKINSGVNFLMDTLQIGPVIDAGGPKRQLMGDLGRYLFDGAPSRTVKMASGIPILPNLEAAEVLQNFGKMLAYCYQNNEFVVGRVFPDKYFGLIKSLLRVNLPLSDDLVIRLSEDEICSDENMRWMWDVYTERRPLGDDDKAMMELIGICDDQSEIPEDLAGIKNLIKKYLLEDYTGNLRFKVLAAHAIAEGIKSGLHVLVQNFENETDAEVSLKVQGVKFDRADIARRITCSKHDPVVNLKAEWLKQLILDPSTTEEWIKSLLITITGVSAVTPKTSITIDPTSANFCTAHTCPKSIEIPNKHVHNGTDHSETQNVDHLPDSSPSKIATYKRYFKNNLQLTMNATGFDMG